MARSTSDKSSQEGSPTRGPKSKKDKPKKKKKNGATTTNTTNAGGPSSSTTPPPPPTEQTPLLNTPAPLMVYPREPQMEATPETQRAAALRRQRDIQRQHM